MRHLWQVTTQVAGMDSGVLINISVVSSGATFRMEQLIPAAGAYCMVVYSGLFFYSTC